MRVFVTGATGFVGSAVVRELLDHGHQVIGLARSEASAEALRKAGAGVQSGSIEDLESLKSGAAAADAVLHLAFNHDFSRLQQNCEDDGAAILAMGSVLEGSDRPIIVTSGLALLAPGRLALESDPPATGFPRLSESSAVTLAERGVRASSVRLSPSTHGAGDHGFVPMLIGVAREKGVAAYVGDGANRWPGVHRFDAARVYRLAVEQGAPLPAYHAVADEGVPMKQIAETIGRGLGLPTVSISPEETEAHFGWMARFVGMDIPASGEITRTALGWAPKEIGLLEDIEQNYF